jgi:hypothetical protein
MHSLLNKCKKTHFLNGISSKFLILKNILYLINVYQYHTPLKISPKNSIHNPSFEIYIQIFKIYIIFSQNILYIQNFQCLLDFLK